MYKACAFKGPKKGHIAHTSFSQGSSDEDFNADSPTKESYMLTCLKWQQTSSGPIISGRHVGDGKVSPGGPRVRIFVKN